MSEQNSKTEAEQPAGRAFVPTQARASTAHAAIDPSKADDAPRMREVEANTRVPQTLFVLDTTAKAGFAAREHQQIVEGLIKNFKFEPGVPLELPMATAIKFLKHDAFIRTDKEGNPQPYNRRPKQPDELGAGEAFHMEDDETIAKYGELTNMALLQRTLELPGGEAVRDKGDRASMIAFLQSHELQKREQNRAKQGDIGRDEFVPEAEVEDAA